MSFDAAFSEVVGIEGGYTDGKTGASAYDPGGETKYGISKRAYPNVDIANLTLDQAKDIYRRDYWNAISGDNLPWPLGLYVFDCAVNQGTGVAKSLLQHSLGVQVDGVLGPDTLAAAQRISKEGMALFMADRAIHYAATGGFETFGRGWFKRLFILAMNT